MKIFINGESVEVPGGGEGGSSGEVYSAEETRIGTWIDGKPIYRKCVFVPSVVGDTNVFLMGDIQDRDEYISIRMVPYGDVIITDNIFFNFPESMRIWYSKEEGICYQVPSTYNITHMTVILEYTKTTD